MTAVIPIDEHLMLVRAARALGKIDLYGERGVTMCSADEIEAMALLLAALGLPALAPGAPVPASFHVQKVG
jgi:hypothetical protein